MGMERIELNGHWEMKAVDAYRTDPAAWESIKGWNPAVVPGTVHTDLMARSVIPDPYIRMNENDVQWVEDILWCYRREFTVVKEQLALRTIELVAEGLDTYAEISVNGKKIGTTENMFVEHRFNIKKYLVAGRNTIEILFDSPEVRSKQLEKKQGALRVALEPHRVFVRKAQYSFSWDWGPKLTTSGIWRPIYIELSTGPVLKDPYVKTLELKSRSAVLELSVSIAQFKAPVKVTAKIDGPLYSESISKKASSSTVRFTVNVNDPHLWWPNGHGTHPLYTAQFTLHHKDGTTSEIATSFGIRTIGIEQEKDKEGRSFIILVNGKRIFCKGADWIPSDNFIPRIKDSTYERLLTLARDANMNMIRIWGGGIYEQDLFYRLCDKLGLLVWQDFMFACGEYPQTKPFLASVKDEAEKAVLRLRNHPSIAVWCGNNECEWLFCTENPDKMPDDMNGAVIFRDLLPGVLKTLDTSRPYWRSSPFGAGFPNDESNGTHHQWHVWSFWKDYKEYNNVNARFVSEFGFQAPANILTWEEVTLPQDRTPQHPVIEHHNKQVEGQERLFRFQAGHYSVGTNFNDFVYRGQLVQANALKTAVEHWRRRKFNTAGALFWQLNDCWPVSSWSVIDSGLRPKAAYFYAKRFYAPLLVSFKQTESGLEVWGTNDTFDRFQGTVQLVLSTFSGDKLSVEEEKISLLPNSSSKLKVLKLQEPAVLKSECTYLTARIRNVAGEVCENRYFFTEPKYLDIPESLIDVRTRSAGDGTCHITLCSDHFAKDVRVESIVNEIELSDNYFDLDAGVPRTIHCVTAMSADELKRCISIVSYRNDGNVLIGR